MKKMVNGYKGGDNMRTNFYIRIKVLAICITAITLVGLSAEAQNRQEILSSELLKSTAVAVFEKDSSHTYRWNTATSAYEDLWRNLYTYNTSGNIGQIEYQLWDSNTKNWAPKWREVFTYNSSAQLAECEFLEYNATSKQWVSSQVFTYTYNGTVLLTCLVENWIATSSSYVNWRMDSFIYDLNGRQKEYKIEYWNTTSNAWVSSLRNTPVYNNNGLLDQEVSEAWSTAAAKWGNLSSEVYTYNAQNQKTQLQKRSWDLAVSTTWIPSDRFTYLYTNNQVTTTTQYKYVAATSTFVNASKSLYKYDTNGNQTEEVNQTFNTTTSGWDNTMKQMSFWSKSAIGTSLPNPETMEMSMYPNPAFNELHITGIESGSTIAIYDYSGRIVKSVVDYTVGNAIDVSDLALGMYIIKANDQVSKFQKQ